MKKKKRKSDNKGVIVEKEIAFISHDDLCGGTVVFQLYMLEITRTHAELYFTKIVIQGDLKGDTHTHAYSSSSSEEEEA